MIEFTGHLKGKEDKMDFQRVATELTKQELEDLLVAAYASGGPFVVENIRTIGDQKEVQIRYMGTTKRRTIAVGKKARNESEVTEAVQH